MRIKVSRSIGQVLIMLLIISCQRNSNEIVVVPPPTHPLSRAIIGYGVVNVSYILVVSEPEKSDVSIGYLRRGSIVQVLERRSININGRVESWVLTEGLYRGWIRESVLDIYDLKAQAETASENMPP